MTILPAKDTSSEKLRKAFSGPPDLTIDRIVSNDCRKLKLYKVMLNDVYIRHAFLRELSIDGYVIMDSFWMGTFLSKHPVGFNILSSILKIYLAIL